MKPDNYSAISLAGRQEMAENDRQTLRVDSNNSPEPRVQPARSTGVGSLGYGGIPKKAAA